MRCVSYTDQLGVCIIAKVTEHPILKQGRSQPRALEWGEGQAALTSGSSLAPNPFWEEEGGYMVQQGHSYHQNHLVIHERYIFLLSV